LTDIYVMLLNDKIILETFKPTMYKNWLKDNENIEISRVLTVTLRYGKISEPKKSLYNSLKRNYFNE